MERLGVLDELCPETNYGSELFLPVLVHYQLTKMENVTPSDPPTLEVAI